MKILLYVFFVCLSVSVHAAPIPKQAKLLIQQFESINDVCVNAKAEIWRDDAVVAQTEIACEKRNQIYEKLKASGWCLGPSNLPQPAQIWMACSKINQPERIRVFAFEPNRKINDDGVVGDKRFVTGDTVPLRNIFYRLYLDRPCGLPVLDLESKRYFYWTNGSLERIGCWYKTLDDGFVIMYADGTLEKQPSWEMLPEALINGDGTATITEPDYDSQTAVQKFNEKQWAKRLKMRKQGMY